MFVFGGCCELVEICGYIVGLLLDCDCLLWEMWVIEGGVCSDIVVVMFKVYYVVVDGVVGVNLLFYLCSL